MAVQTMHSTAELTDRMGRATLSDSVTTPVNTNSVVFYAVLTRQDYFLLQLPPPEVIHILQSQLPISNLLQPYLTRNEHSQGRSLVPDLLQKVKEQSQLVSLADPFTRFKALLDMCDKAWSESKLLEARWREFHLQHPARANLLYIAQVQIKFLCDEIRRLEEMHSHNSELSTKFREYKETRIEEYDANHPLRVLQPYLKSVSMSMPDYTIYSLLDMVDDS